MSCGRAANWSDILKTRHYGTAEGGGGSRTSRSAVTFCHFLLLAPHSLRGWGGGVRKRGSGLMPVILPLKPLGVKHSYHAASLLRALFLFFYYYYYLWVWVHVFINMCATAQTMMKKTKTPSGIGSFRKALAFLVFGGWWLANSWPVSWIIWNKTSEKPQRCLRENNFVI